MGAEITDNAVNTVDKAKDIDNKNKEVILVKSKKNTCKKADSGFDSPINFLKIKVSSSPRGQGTKHSSL